MNNARSYFESLLSHSDFPSPKLEEYRYSKVLQNILDLNISIGSGKSIDLPWDSDRVFSADQKNANTSTKIYEQLPDIYHRHQNYFKNISLAVSKDFVEISCENEEMTLSFVATEGSVLTEKIYLHVPAHKTVKIFIKCYTEKNSLAIPMIMVDAQEHTHVELIYLVDEEFNKGVLAPLFELTAGEKSHVSLQTFSKNLNSHRLSFIGYCIGAESHIDLRTGFYLENKETTDLFVRIFHEAPDSTSNQMIKTVTDHAAAMNFNGQIYANNKAHNIYAYQMLKGMILGDDAEIYARPQLDIEYYELACSHGVSIGRFDPEELFYLQSRGIDKKHIYPLLFYGFFSEPFVDINTTDFWVSKIKEILKIESI
ncbi:MAG: SufD family Fe-S cluster assembly protein [Brevinema sp.]